MKLQSETIYFLRRTEDGTSIAHTRCFALHKNLAEQNEVCLWQTTPAIRLISWLLIYEEGNLRQLSAIPTRLVGEIFDYWEHTVNTFAFCLMAILRNIIIRDSYANRTLRLSVTIQFCYFLKVRETTLIRSHIL